MEDETNTLGTCLALIAFPKLRWIFVYLSWIHIFMVVAMLKFASIWHRSMFYVWYLCPSLCPLSHGSTLYSGSHACLFHSWIYLVLVCSHELVTFLCESKVLMYCRCLLYETLRPSWISPRSDNLFSQSSRLSYPYKYHALRGIMLYPNPITNMWWDP